MEPVAVNTGGNFALRISFSFITPLCTTISASRHRSTGRHAKFLLSGGEQQRVALARAIVNHPAILLADEPTGNLDTANAEAVLTLLTELNRFLGQTTLMITHNPEAAAFARRTVRMRDGRVLA